LSSQAFTSTGLPSAAIRLASAIFVVDFVRRAADGEPVMSPC